MTFTGMVYFRLKIVIYLIYIFNIYFYNFSSDDVTSGSSYRQFPIFRLLFCSEISSETTQDNFFKFSRMIDKGLKLVPFESQVSSLKSAEAR